MKILAMMATATGFWGVGLWSAPVGGQSLPPACSGTACVGSDWGAATSTNSYMASHREQRHSVVTSDNAIHIIVNTGTQASYNGGPQTGTLQLYSSTNNGGTWVNTYTLVGTETLQSNKTVSTDDVALRTDGAGNQFLDIAYDTETGGGNALMFTELRYRPGLSLVNRWNATASYPLTISSSGSTIYQQPAFAQDQDGNLWLADLELNSSITQGGIALYQRKNGTWGSVAVNIPNNTFPPNGPSQSLITSQGYSAFAHAPRPVFITPNINNLLFGTIGLLFQTAEPNSTTLDCLYWTTITGDAASGGTATTPVELSQYSNAPSTLCNLPAAQSTYPDTALSVATDLTTGNQYLGFVITSPAGSTTGEAVYAMSYNGTTNMWNTSGQSFNNNNNNNTVYVKSVYATDNSANTYSYMIVNLGGTALELYASPTLSTTQTNTMYTAIDNLTYGSFGPVTNPRIEAPQYVNSNSTFTTVPIWLQYTSTFPLNPQSLLYWNSIPN